MARRHAKCGALRREVFVTQRVWTGILFAIVVFGLAVLPLLPVWVDSASANQCANACYSRHSQCRISRKGSSSCDAQLRQCLRQCVRRR